MKINFTKRIIGIGGIARLGFSIITIMVILTSLYLPQSPISNVPSARAASISGVAATVSTDANAGCGDTNWGTATAANLNSDNTGYATITGTSWDNNNPTYRIVLSNFGLAITNGNSIDGVVVDLLGWNVAGGGAVDQLVQLTKVAGTGVGSNYAKTTTNWPTADPGTTYRNYGGATDFWGTTWSESEVESTGFGLTLCLQAKAANQTFNMDHVRITVYHSLHTTTLSDGTNPGDSSVAPGGSITTVDGATLTTSTGTDAITAMTVNLSSNTGVGTLTITDGADTVLGSIGGGTGSGIVTGSNNISITSTDATTGGTAFKVKVTPLSHGSMPSVPGGSYSITAPITDWAGTNSKAGQASDTSSTVTIDNLSPNGATATSGSAGDAAVTVNWTTSSSSDFNTTSGSVVYRWTGSSAGSEVPTEGSTPSAGDTNSTATAACVISSNSSTALSKTDGTGGSAGCTNTALTNGQAYTYKVFQKDNYGNYDAGVSIGTFTPAASGITISGTVYGTDESTPLAGTPAIRMSIGAAASTTVNLSSGTFTFSGVTQPADGTVITLWMDTTNTDNATLVFKYGSTCAGGTTSCTGLSLYKDGVIVGIDYSNTSNTIANSALEACDNDSGGCSDTDVGFTSTTGALNLTWSTNQIRIKDTDAKYAPGGTVTAAGFKQSAGAVTGGSATWDINGAFTVSGGTFTSTSGTLQISGAVTGGGTFSANGGTVTYDSASAQNVATFTYNNLTIDGGSTKSLTGSTVVGGTLSVTAGDTLTTTGTNHALTSALISIASTGTLNINGSTLTITDTSGTLLTNSGTFTAGTGSTTIFSGAGTPTALLSGTFTGSSAFYNLTLSPTIGGPATYAMGAAFTVNNNFTIDPTSAGANTLTVNLGGTTIVTGLTDIKAESSGLSTLDTVSGSNHAFTTGTINIRTAGTFNANNSVVTINGTSGPLFTRAGTFNAGGSTVNFSETSTDLVLTSSPGTITFYTLQISMAGRTGTLGSATTVNYHLTVSGGTLADGGYQITGNINGTLSMASGTGLFLGSAATATTFPTSFTAAHISLNSASTVTYASDQVQTVSGVPTYGNLTIQGTSTKSLDAATIIAGTTTLSAGTLNSNGFDLTVGGNWVNNGGAFTPGTNTVTFNGTGAQAVQGSAASQTFYGLVVAKTVGTTLSVSGSTTTLSVNGFTETTGNFTAPATMNIAAGATLTAGTYTAGTNTNVTGGNWTNNGGTFTPGTNTITFSGTAGQAINGSLASQTFYALVVAKTAGQTLSVSGSTTALTVTNFTETTGNFTAPATMDINGNVTLSAGTYTAGTATTVFGDWTNNGGTFTPGTNTVTFDGTGAQAINGSATSQTFYGLTLAKTVGQTLSVSGSTTTLNINTFIQTTGNFTAPATVNIAGNATLSAGTYTAGANTNLSGNWTNGGGSFSGGTGTVTLNGADSSTQAISGNTTFNNLYASTTGNSAGRTIQYAGNSTTTVSGTWTMTGATGKILTLQSSDTNSWTITPSGNSVSYLYLSRSTNTVGTICATYSTGDAFNSGYTVTSGGTCVNSAPGVPSLDSPTDTATNQSVNPSIKTTATDTDADYVQYKIILCENSAMTTNCQTFDQSTSQTGWSGQNANGNTAYTSGTQGTHTVQTPLQYSFTYYWKSYAIDPAGTNTWSSTQVSPYSFSTQAAPSGSQIPAFKGGIKIFGKTVIK